MSFEPRGKVAVLMDAMRAQPEKNVWSADDVAQTMEVARGNLPAYLQAVVTRGLLHRKIDGGKSFFSLKPFAVSPGAGLEPRMIPSPEYSAEERAAAATDVRAPKAEPNWLPPKMISARELVRAPLPAPSPTAPAPIQTCAPPPVAEEPEALEPAAEVVQEAEVATEFNAALWLDGDLDLYGLVETEDGAHRVPAAQVAKLRKLLAWMPA